MKLPTSHHLSYCTNIHPAETWEETWEALIEHTLEVREQVLEEMEMPEETPFAIGLRLSAQAAEELLEGHNLDEFKDWLAFENCYIYTINGFPFGAFHGTSVKEKVYQPDWTTTDRLVYTLNLFNIIAELAPRESGGSVSTLPGSFKEFEADEEVMFKHLYACAEHIDLLSEQYEKDLHLGLEPEPLGHFENTSESIAFFQRFHQWAENNDLPTDLLTRCVGINYDTCHFALEFEDAEDSLFRLEDAGIRISKIHLSNALEIDPADPDALDAIEAFEEPTYLHQFMLKEADGEITRFKDLPEALEELDDEEFELNTPAKARIHFHIPLYAEPAAPLGSTREHAESALRYIIQRPHICEHIEMETYTWGVLPNELQLPIDEQLTKEYLWTLKQW